jgi:N-acetylneuraminic acid mutarotase
MAYDAATGKVVLFGGESASTSLPLSDTWAWDGSAWAKQHPTASPPARWGAAMAYDAATRTVVMFGGEGTTATGSLGDTWVWDGSTWTKQHPTASPPARLDASMAYDTATRTVVLFGGSSQGIGDPLHSTWVWDGSTWTQRSPAAHPSARLQASMAYDAATGKVVLFGGLGGRSELRQLGGTWVWDGSAWAKQSLSTSPPGRYAGSMAYDAATRTVVLFGGYSNADGGRFGDTWAWDGSAWTIQTPAASPPPRFMASMAYDAAARNVVLFGGSPADPAAWTYGSGASQRSNPPYHPAP